MQFPNEKNETAYRKIKRKKNLENKIKEINDKYNSQVKSFTSDFDTMRKEVKDKQKKISTEVLLLKIY